MLKCNKSESKDCDNVLINQQEKFHLKQLKDKKSVCYDLRKSKRLLKSLGPDWFQELSDTQIFAVDSLHEAVSCQVEETRLKRCRAVLHALGINPLPKKFQIVAAIRFGQENDLAFLWFIYDVISSSCLDIGAKKTFQLNERLILSSICHLDMMTTLRELDRILPIRKKTYKNQRKNLDVKCASTQSYAKYGSLYLKPKPKPKLQPTRRFLPPMRLPAKFRIYEQYKNPSYVIKNEASRWFSDKNLFPTDSQSVVKKILCDRIKNVVSAPCNDREKIMNNLCEKHRLESTKFNQILHKLINDEMPRHLDDEYLKDCDPFERGIIYGVQLELAKTETEYKEVAENFQKRVMVETIMREIVENAADLKNIHLCKRCKYCVIAKQLNESMSKTNTTGLNFEADFIEDEGKSGNEIKFFHGPSTSSPFQFDYEKIFALNFLGDYGFVRNSINMALKLDKYLTEDNAITACLQDMWKMELKSWDEKRQAGFVEENERVVADFNGVRSKEDAFGVLSKGIALMRKNPKFVLVSMPKVQRLPILREWVLQRYGFRHSNSK